MWPNDATLLFLPYCPLLLGTPLHTPGTVHPVGSQCWCIGSRISIMATKLVIVVTRRHAVGKRDN